MPAWRIGWRADTRTEAPRNFPRLIRPASITSPAPNQIINQSNRAFDFPLTNHNRPFNWTVKNKQTTPRSTAPAQVQTRILRNSLTYSYYIKSINVIIFINLYFNEWDWVKVNCINLFLFFLSNKFNLNGFDFNDDEIESNLIELKLNQLKLIAFKKIIFQ